MKVYIAGASKEIDLVERYVRAVRNLGHVITHDWCAEIRKVGDANPRDLPRGEVAMFALEDLNGVATCDLLWLLIPQNNSAGCWIEFGYALKTQVSAGSKGIPSLMVSGDFEKSIFCALPEVLCCTDHDIALQTIRE